jgi:D-xylose transport system substrate-binding protein
MLRAIRWPTLLGLVVVVSIVLAACAPAATPAPTAVPPTEVPTMASPTEVPPTTAPATNSPVATPPTTGGQQGGGATVQVPQNATLGQILADNKGMTLYVFKNDKPGQSNCTDACAQNWPPLTVAQGAQPTASADVTGKLAVIQRSDGSNQVTINDMPLYTFKNDAQPGDTKGQGINSIWYVVSPAGEMITTSVAAAPTAAPSAMSGKIALLLPETKTTRYETADRPYFEAKFKQLCPSCDIIYSNANQDANSQVSQAEAALTNGAKVLVLDPVDSAAAGAIADKAKAQGVPVIAYDRLILNSDAVSYYISFDNAKVGMLQAQSLVDQLTKLGMTNPQIVMINGAPTDNNAKLFKQGAHSIFDPLVQAGKLTIAKEYDTPDWSPDQAQNEMQQALTALGNKVDGVYAANDGTGGGAIAAMKAASLSPLPPVTGQDAELAAIQRILAGQQYMTVYKAIKPEAEGAATLAYDLLTNTPVPADMTGGMTVNNAKIDVPSVLLTPVAVTKDNVKDTIVQDNFWTVQQICTTDFAAACTAAGLQ